MNELFAKLTSLEYELFSVFVPGLVLSLFFLVWWGVLGSLAPLLTGNLVPELTVASARAIVDSLNAPTGAGVAFAALALSYFSGHILLWIARSGGAAKAEILKSWKRVGYSLLFSIPRAESNFNASLQRLYEKVQAKFAAEGVQLEWRELYPVVKIYLGQNLKGSLVANYQNKYTLHRSITAAGSLLFWLCIFSMALACLSSATVPASNYAVLTVLALAAVLIVWGFSASFAYHWEMFGNTIVTESYACIFAPKSEAKSESKK